MWATAEESRQAILDLYRSVWVHSDATVDALELDATGTVPWWPAHANPVSLHVILVHMIAETNRHAGHADLVRELIDGSSGLRADTGNLPDTDAQWWIEYRQRLERTAVEASSRGVAT